MQNREIDYLESIIEYCQDVVHFMERINYDRKLFLEERMDQYGVSFCIEQIGELVGKLRKAGYDEKYPFLPWNEISGMRNHIAHDYGRVDLRLVYDTSVNDIPDLLQKCKDILQKESSLENKIKNAEQKADTGYYETSGKENER